MRIKKTQSLICLVIILAVTAFGFIQISQELPVAAPKLCCNDNAHYLNDLEHSYWDRTDFNWEGAYDPEKGTTEAYFPINAATCISLCWSKGYCIPEPGFGSSTLCSNRCDWSSTSLHCLTSTDNPGSRITCSSWYYSVSFPAPQNLSISVPGLNPVLSWGDTNPYEYTFKVYRNGNYIGQTTGTSYTDTGVEEYRPPGEKIFVTYTYMVKAYTPVREASASQNISMWIGQPQM